MKWRSSLIFLLVSRGALLCLVEKEKGLLLSQLTTKELSQILNLK